MAEWLQNYWWTLLLLLLLLLLGIPRLISWPGVKQHWDKFLLSLVSIGPWFRKIKVARFCRTLATLLSNGVVLLTALAIVRRRLVIWLLGKSVGISPRGVYRGRYLFRTYAGRWRVP
ncbi:MAG: hypothetical protein H6963_06295 [Chromatiaceae bacterium]|nr:hypothetical protein [Chromatiaceae bacterium]